MPHLHDRGRGTFVARWLAPPSAIVLLLVLIVCFSIPPSAQVPTSTDEPRPNVLFVAVDDLNAIVGFLSEQPGSPLATIYPDANKRAEIRKLLTPNLDRLAATGRPFHRAYCPAPLCGPSRTAILTGTPPDRSGYHEHKTHFREFDRFADAITLPQWLRQHGYHTVGIGKVFHHSQPAAQGDGKVVDWTDRERSWDAYPLRPEGGPGDTKDVWPKYNAPDTYIRYGATRVPFERMRDRENAVFVAELLRERKATIKQTDGTPTTVTLPREKPFFLACGLFAPHLPWCVPGEFFARFPTTEMAIDADTIKRWHEDCDDLPRSAISLTALASGGYNELSGFMARAVSFDGPEAILPLMLELNQAYLASVAFADACIGLMLDALEASGRADDTIVVLWGDHGYHLGEKARLGKSALWNEATHTVLVIRTPRQVRAGEPMTAPVSLQGIYPTITDLVGLPRAPRVDGASLMPHVLDPKANAPHVLTSMGPGRHAVRDDRWCYIRYHADQEELYDDIADPEQRTNLAKSPEHAATKQRLAGLLPTNEATPIR
jgi:arylsulfatase A-like enzyme